MGLLKKNCSRCGRRLLLILFSKNKSRADGYAHACKVCTSSDGKEWRRSNQKVIKERNRINYTRTAKQQCAQKKERRAYSRDNERNRYKTDLQFKLSKLLRGRLGRSLARNSVYGSAVKDLDCTVPELKTHLESLFVEGMSWQNHGKKNGWQIDHARPLATFDLTNPEEFKQAVHFSNLQPLWFADNQRKKPRRLEL